MATVGAPLEKKYVKHKIANLNASLQISEEDSEKRDEILTHITAVENDPVFQLDPEFPTGLQWFNSSPLSFERELKGKIVVLDFFTYCCINCMHVLPDLATLEQRYSDRDGVVVIGVHSAKFHNEKVSDNIRNAVARYNINHPVVNDCDIVLWERLGITCWPTVVIIGPDRQLLYYIIGEGHGAELMLFMDVAVQYYSDARRLSSDPIELTPAICDQSSILKFPGKICTDSTGERLYVADSSHNKVLVVNRNTGVVEHVYGSGVVGRSDGVGGEVRFNCPQGLVWHNGALYVADTENHLIRKINLSTHIVTTITGTGCQGNDKEGGGVGVSQEISSPWDLQLGTSPGSDQPNLLYIAMAGTHQIWVHFLEEGEGLKGIKYPAGTTVRFCGSGDEANRNNSYPHKAAFAQPSGISLGSDGNLYVADSESSCVRAVVVATGSAKAVVGGAIDPLDLFAYGDVDGKAREVRLQHPLGVVWNKRDGMVYITDSYNHKVKVVNPRTKECTTLARTGVSGLNDGPFEHAQFSEPGGLCVDTEGKSLFVADTNNHCIRVVDLEKKEVSQLVLTMEDATPTTRQDSPGLFKRLTGKGAQSVQSGYVFVPRRGEAKIMLRVTTPDKCHLTEGAPSAWQVLPGDAGAPCVLQGGQTSMGKLTDDHDITLIFDTNFSTGQSSTLIQVEVVIYFCEESGICHKQEAILDIPIDCSDSAGNTVASTISYSPELPEE